MNYLISLVMSFFVVPLFCYILIVLIKKYVSSRHERLQGHTVRDSDRLSLYFLQWTRGEGMIWCNIGALSFTLTVKRTGKKHHTRKTTCLSYVYNRMLYARSAYGVLQCREYQVREHSLLFLSFPLLFSPNSLIMHSMQANTRGINTSTNSLALLHNNKPNFGSEIKSNNVYLFHEFLSTYDNHGYSFT